MRVLVVGSGAREHALCWRLAQEATEVACTPGNAGIAQQFETLSVKAGDASGIEALVRRSGFDLVVVGPEQPLIDGLVDHLQSAGIAVFGPDADAAKLEGSKKFAKEKMHQAGVPTAEFGVFTDPEEALEFARSRFDAGLGVAVKASGNALGKGVIVCHQLDEAEDAIGMMLVEHELGAAGATIVVEDRLAGREFSLLTVCSGTHFRSLPVAQDYKRALDGDRGPNTGGMGSFAPASWVSSDLIARTETEVVAPMLELMAQQGTPFRGVLFSGIMVQDSQPYCLEYNVRMGDPETQSVVRLIGPGFLPALTSVAHGSDQIPAIETQTGAAVSVVIASPGYPGKIETGLPIQIGPMPEGIEVFHAGTDGADGRWVTQGGRVLTISAHAPNPEDARRLAYAGVSEVHFPGMQYRRDIGA